MAKHGFFSDGHKKGMTRLRQRSKLLRDSFIGVCVQNSTTSPCSSCAQNSYGIKSATLEKCCENMPWQTCLERAGSCWCGALCVCGHAIMLSPVIVKCELRSAELCELWISLPHSAVRALIRTRWPVSSGCWVGGPCFHRPQQPC